jgi:Phage integrase family
VAKRQVDAATPTTVYDAQGLPCAIRSDRGSGQDAIHMLRHGCGYTLANAGHDTRALQAYLGHKNIQHTVQPLSAIVTLRGPLRSGPPNGLIQKHFRFAPRTCGPPCGRLEVRKTERTGQSAALIAHRGGSPHA